MNAIQKNFRRKLVGFWVFSLFLIFFVLGMCAVKAFSYGAAELTDNNMTQTETSGKYTEPDVIKYAFLAAAIAAGMGAIGGGLAVGYVGSAAMGVIGEKPEMAVRALLFVGLAEGIAIYGLIISIMILGKV